MADDVTATSPKVGRTRSHPAVTGSNEGVIRKRTLLIGLLSFLCLAVLYLQMETLNSRSVLLVLSSPDDGLPWSAAAAAAMAANQAKPKTTRSLVSAALSAIKAATTGGKPDYPANEPTAGEKEDEIGDGSVNNVDEVDEATHQALLAELRQRDPMAGNKNTQHPPRTGLLRQRFQGIHQKWQKRKWSGKLQPVTHHSPVSGHASSTTRVHAKSNVHPPHDVSSGTSIHPGVAMTQTTNALHSHEPTEQIVLDFRPWQHRGVTLQDIYVTRALLQQESMPLQVAPITTMQSTSIGTGNHSITLTESDVQDVTRYITAPSPDGVFTVLIYAQNVYFLHSDVRRNGPKLTLSGRQKVGSLYLMLTSLARKHALPDVQFLWNVNPITHTRRPPETGRDDTPQFFNFDASTATTAAAGQEEGASSSQLPSAPLGLAPLLSMCKRAGDYDVLAPNTYFRSPATWNFSAGKMHTLAAASPWQSRHAAIWWRGASGDEWPAAAARVSVIGRWHGHPFTDVAFTNNFGALWGAWTKRRKPWVNTLPARTGRVQYGETNKQSVFTATRYRYALHLPGSFRGTYSRALQYLLWSGTCVFLYDAAYYEFYYIGLRPWVHYVPVNLTNLKARWQWAEEHPERAARIAAAGAAFAAERLSSVAVSDYWARLLRSYAAVQRFDASELPRQMCGCWSVTRPPRTPGTVTGRCQYICDPGPMEEGLKRHVPKHWTEGADTNEISEQETDFARDSEAELQR